ncbi:hypothetical protein T492DRAFT_889575 [Pavlovales sp. CCMP2436]|nr:hypothetical protein T492DRAFT_889575 [Pavlovales sp. CCMP2436]
MRTLLIALAACTAASCAHRGPVRARSAVRRALPLAATASPFDAVAVGRPSELLQMLGDLKSAGVAPNFDSLRLAPRLVAQQELTRVTRMEPELLLGGKPLDYTKVRRFPH